MKLKIVSLTPIFLFVLGCAVALVPESNDPKTKINQATQLFLEEGRPFGAVTLLNQSIELSKKHNNKPYEALAEFYLGEIYKTPGPRGEKLKDPQKALEHYANAILIYDELKFYKNEAFVYWNQTLVHQQLGKSKEMCDDLRTAEKLFKQKGVPPNIILHPALASEKFLESIDHYKIEFKCSSKAAPK